MEENEYGNVHPSLDDVIKAAEKIRDAQDLPSKQEDEDDNVGQQPSSTEDVLTEPVRPSLDELISAAQKIRDAQGDPPGSSFAGESSEREIGTPQAMPPKDKDQADGAR